VPTIHGLIPIESPAGPFIALCWTIFVAVWLVAALFTKRTVERSASIFRLLWIGAAVAVVAAFSSSGATRAFDRLPPGWDHVWAYTPALGLAAGAITALGLFIAVWARFTLGANWSGTVTFKENHELITRGPYAFVRHPIYTGMLAMLLGTALINGHAGGFAILVFATIMLWLKARDEERMMIKHFPDTYPPYKARVKALVPFVL